MLVTGWNMKLWLLSWFTKICLFFQQVLGQKVSEELGVSKENALSKI